MGTREKGELAALKVQLRAIEKEIIVSKPLMEGTRYDLILDEAGKLSRVQVKYSDGKASHAEGVIQVTLSKEDGGKAYTKGEIDYLLVYLPYLDKICKFEADVFDGKCKLFVRVKPTKNKQTKGCLMAETHLW